MKLITEFYLTINLKRLIIIINLLSWLLKEDIPCIRTWRPMIPNVADPQTLSEWILRRWALRRRDNDFSWG